MIFSSKKNLAAWMLRNAAGSTELIARFFARFMGKSFANMRQVPSTAGSCGIDELAFTLEEIAAEWGFSNQEHFSTA
jgi:AraC-like DNA-binding protein